MTNFRRKIIAITEFLSTGGLSLFRKNEHYTCGLCYKPYMVKNPHPDAGIPETLLEVGAVYECIPCNLKALHSWSQRARKAEQEIEQLHITEELILGGARGLRDSFPLEGDWTCDFCGGKQQHQGLCPISLILGGLTQQEAYVALEQL